MNKEVDFGLGGFSQEKKREREGEKERIECITAASAVSGIIADLDTTIMFATAGTLNREGAETFADHR